MVSQCKNITTHLQLLSTSVVWGTAWYRWVLLVRHHDCSIDWQRHEGNDIIRDRGHPGTGAMALREGISADVGGVVGKTTKKPSFF